MALFILINLFVPRLLLIAVKDDQMPLIRAATIHVAISLLKSLLEQRPTALGSSTPPAQPSKSGLPIREVSKQPPNSPLTHILLLVATSAVSHTTFVSTHSSRKSTTLLGPQACN